MTRRRREYEQQSWWTADHRGLPGWGIVLAAALIAGLGVVIVLALSGSPG